MLKEIHEQPQVARELLHLLKQHEDLKRILEAIRGARNLYLIGCGTSYHACLAGSVDFARLAGKPAVPVLAPQFIPQYAPTVGRRTGFISQSERRKTY